MLRVVLRLILTLLDRGSLDMDVLWVEKGWDLSMKSDIFRIAVHGPTFLPSLFLPFHTRNTITFLPC
jgi:hypothetical protein